MYRPGESAEPVRGDNTAEIQTAEVAAIGPATFPLQMLAAVGRLSLRSAPIYTDTPSKLMLF
jgi:hypothetical protein